MAVSEEPEDGTERVTTPSKRRVETFLRKRGWNHKTPRDGIRRRIYCLASDRRPWYDWGHRLMILVGDDDCGNWSEPEPATWWYRPGEPKRMWRTGYPRPTFEIVTDYKTFKERVEGVNDDERERWSAISTNQDGELILGRQYWGGRFFGMTKAETALLRRYLRAWRRHDWYGLRSWLYSQGLHAAVYVRKPGACNAAPPKGQGGYDHWLCHERRGHDGFHRFRSYAWGDVGGEPIGVFHECEEGTR